MKAAIKLIPAELHRLVFYIRLELLINAPEGEHISLSLKGGEACPNQ